MRLRWVGDARDYVKWDCVFEHARNRFVFYVPMLRKYIDPKCRHPEVQNFFDESKNLESFKQLFPNGFEVFVCGEDYSVENADRYFQGVIARLQTLQNNYRVLVFIDPDTGIAPKRAKSEHLRLEDLSTVWHEIKSQGSLVIYQHASRNNNWKQEIARRLQNHLQIPSSAIAEPYCNEKIARDVCFFVLEKS
jgi:hypothetical protein